MATLRALAQKHPTPAQHEDLDRLDPSPGVGQLAAGVIIAETGGDMRHRDFWSGSHQERVWPVLALGLALLSGSAVLWILTAGTQTGHGGRGVVQTLVLALLALLLLVALITFLGGAAGRGHRYLTELPPWRNLLQDAHSIAAIVLFTILPTEYMINNVGLWDGLKLALPPALLFAGGCIWVMSANRNWPEIEARRLLPPDTASALLTDIGDRSWRRFRLDLHTQCTYRTRPVTTENSEEFVRALGAHTRNQNRIAAAMFILPLVALPIGVGLFFESGQFGQLARHLARGLRDGA
ncbi:hypothetical protein AB0C21_27770 [Spirillospora sp. NPDC049024]